MALAAVDIWLTPVAIAYMSARLSLSLAPLSLSLRHPSAFPLRMGGVHVFVYRSFKPRRVSTSVFSFGIRLDACNDNEHNKWGTFEN